MTGRAGVGGLSLGLCLLLAACVPGDLPDAGGPAPGMVKAATTQDRFEQWLLPSPDKGYLMRARIVRPPGEGPFPLAVINHGSEQDPSRRKRAQQAEFQSLTDWFLKRGYVVVLPERPGHGGGGRYLENQGGCENADYVGSANGAADSIAAAVDFMRKQDFVEPTGTVVAGHSAGALGSLAYAARAPAGLRAVVNFSGGRGGHHLNRPLNNCAPERLVAAASDFGRTSRVPTLWIYAENDSYFPPQLSAAMAEAFRSAGGRVDYVLLPPIGSEGHFVIVGDAWASRLQGFLSSLP
ncbi:MAG: prolyl oligopeptidase family serine peptidase [Rhizobiaceae bacterium]|nr:prolyl oligopeptidase family serine peptidase [Rhizobiaceae bacterium]